MNWTPGGCRGGPGGARRTGRSCGWGLRHGPVLPVRAVVAGPSTAPARRLSLFPHDPYMGVIFLHLGRDTVEAIFTLAANRTQRVNRHNLWRVYKRRLKPEGRRYHSAWSKLSITGETKRPFTRLRIIRGRSPSHEGSAQRPHFWVVQRRRQQVIERHKLTIVCVAPERFVIFLTCLRGHRHSPLSSLSTTSFNPTMSLSLSARAAASRCSGARVSRA